MIRSVVKSFKVPDVEVAAARMSNESALTRMTDSTPKKTWSDLTLVLDAVLSQGSYVSKTSQLIEKVKSAQSKIREEIALPKKTKL